MINTLMTMKQVYLNHQRMQTKVTGPDFTISKVNMKMILNFIFVKKISMPSLMKGQ